MPTDEQLSAAREAGAKAYGSGMGTHLASGKLNCPYTDPDLIAAWLQGYEMALKRAHL